jgi:hypothetical protein
VATKPTSVHHYPQLDPMEQDCLQHWAKYRPKMCAQMEMRRTLVKRVRDACRQTEKAIAELMKKGMSFLEAKNAVQEEWMYLPEENG